MLVQKLSEEYLLNLVDRLNFEIEIRAAVHEGRCENDAWEQPMYLIPMWNIVKKIIAFKPYFYEMNINFPTLEVYRHPIEIDGIFPIEMINVKEEELIYKGEKIIVKYRCI